MLAEFRARVVEHGLKQRALDLLLAALVSHGLLKASGRARTDSTHVISAVRDLNRLELAGESVRACLEALAAAAPDWLAGVVDVADFRSKPTRGCPGEATPVRLTLDGSHVRAITGGTTSTPRRSTAPVPAASTTCSATPTACRWR